MVYKWCIPPTGWLYITYHLLREPETAIEQLFGTGDFYYAKLEPKIHSGDSNGPTVGSNVHARWFHSMFEGAFDTVLGICWKHLFWEFSPWSLGRWSPFQGGVFFQTDALRAESFLSLRSVKSEGVLQMKNTFYYTWRIIPLKKSG